MKKPKRKPITARMKVDCLLERVFLQFGAHLNCALSGDPMKPGDNVQFDHTHAVVHGGRHTYLDIRPVLAEPHKKKTARDVRDHYHVKRLRRRKKRKGREIPSRPFPDQSRPMQSRPMRAN